MDPITDHVQRAQDRLIYRFRKPNILALVASYASEVQELEDAITALRAMRVLATSEGVYLDVLGAIVGQPRQGRSDPHYRLWIAARAMANRSSGTTEQVIAIVKKLVGSARITVRDEPPAGFSITIEDPIDEDEGAEIAKIVSVAKALSVRGSLIWFRSADVFRFAAVANDSVAVVPHGFNGGGFAAASAGLAGDVIWEP
jgi:hypothetical protein